MAWYSYSEEPHPEIDQRITVLQGLFLRAFIALNNPKLMTYFGPSLKNLNDYFAHIPDEYVDNHLVRAFFEQGGFKETTEPTDVKSLTILVGDKSWLNL